MNAAAWETVADLSGIGPGVSVLDVGCGIGRFCAFAGGRGAAVHGIDVDAARLEQALQRLPGADLRLGLLEDLPWPDATFDVVTGFNAFQYALDIELALEQALQRLPGADLRLGLLEDLPWPDATFDVVTGFNAFQYARDIELALAQACRVTRPGGRIAICKWDRPEHNELFALLADVSDRGIDLNQLPASDPVEDALARARLDVAFTGTIPVTIEIADDEALAAALASADAFTAVTGAPHLVDVASPYRQADGSYRFNNRLMYRIAIVAA